MNPATDEEVRKDEIRKGYEIEPDTFVIVGDEDLEKLEPEPSTEIVVDSFLPQGRIGHQYYDRPYYLGPDGDAKTYSRSRQPSPIKDAKGLRDGSCAGRSIPGR